MTIMSVKVNLNDIINGIESQNDSSNSYLNTSTGKIYLISEEDFTYAEDAKDLTEIPGWQKENIETAKEIMETDHYLSLPDIFELNEYNLMEKFSLSILNKKIQEDLYFSLKAKGAFRRFKDKVQKYNLADQWYKYRDTELIEIAKYWCKDNNIEYVD